MEFAIAYLEDNAEVREVICDLLEVKLGVPCLPLAHFSELTKNSNAVLKTKIALLDLELGRNQPNGIEAFNWLVENNYKGKIYFLTGHGKDLALLDEAEDKGAVILEKPLSIEIINKQFPQDLLNPLQDLTL